MNAPYRLTSVDHWHETHGAHMSVVGGWRRVLHYGDPKTEEAVARSAVAACDLSPLSKINVQGKHCEALAARACTLGVPAVGYSLSVPVADQNRVAARLIRLTADRFLVIGEPEECSELQKSMEPVADAIGCAHVQDMSSCFAAFMIVGPKTSTLLKKLSSANIDGIPLSGCSQIPIARTTGIVVRWSDGEPAGWLLLVSRDFGEYVWECILAAGHDLGVRPIGLEAQRAIIAGACR